MKEGCYLARAKRSKKGLAIVGGDKTENEDSAENIGRVEEEKTSQEH